MLEHETQIIIQTLADGAIGSARSIALKDILAADLPKGIKLYLQYEVLRGLHGDLERADHFSSIRFVIPTVQHWTKVYITSIAPEYIFSKEEFAGALDNAVHFVENYLCRPQWTLEHFMFEKSDHVTSTELQDKFGFLSEYLYYGTLVLGFMKQKDLQEISAAEFRSLLARIDDQIVKQHNSKELAQLTRPIFEFLSVQKDITGKAIPLKPLLVFFEDKKMNEVKEHLERACHTRNIAELTIDHLTTVIEDLHSNPGATVEMSALNSVREDQPRQEINLVPSAPSVDETSPPVSEPEDTDTPPSGADRRNIALSLTFSGMTDMEQPATSPSPPVIKEIIDDALRERFIHSIFQNDEAYYNVVMEALNSMLTWRDASLYLQTFYQTGGINPYLPDVVQFTDLIHSHFSSVQQ